MTLASDAARIVGIPPASCRRIALGAHRRYKKFFIPKKRKGEFRLVAQPAREVKSIQRAIVDVLSPLLPVHDAATAYKVGSSILENAKRHSGARFITKLDFSAFFPSIDAASIAGLLRKSINGIEDSDVAFILNACLWRGDGGHALCIGAPSSPFLSNAVMYGFDSIVSEFSTRSGCIYTRYSDDITISAREPDILHGVEAFIREQCRVMERPRLTINERKRIAVGRSAAMKVTGLTLTNQGGVTVGRSRKRGVRSGVNRLIKFGMSLDDMEILKGEIAFVLSVEPKYRDVLLNTYGAKVMHLLPQV